MICFYNYKNICNRNSIFIFYLLASFLIDIAGKIIFYYLDYDNNLIFFNLLSLLEIIVFSIYYLNYINKKIIVSVIIGIGIIYPLIEIIVINTDNITSFQSYSKVLVAFLITIMSLYYIMQQIKRELEIDNRNLIFVIIAYFSLELIFLLPLNFLINYDSPIVLYIWFLRLGVNLLFYSYLIRFIWKNGKMQKQSQLGL